MGPDDRNKHTLLNHLDKPARFLFFTIDEFLSLSIPIFVGLGVGYAFTGTCASLFCFWGVKTLKKLSGGGALRDIIYWYLPTSQKGMKIFVPSYIREWGA